MAGWTQDPGGRAKYASSRLLWDQYFLYNPDSTNQSFSPLSLACKVDLETLESRVLTYLGRSTQNGLRASVRVVAVSQVTGDHASKVFRSLRDLGADSISIALARRWQIFERVPPCVSRRNWSIIHGGRFLFWRYHRRVWHNMLLLSLTLARPFILHSLPAMPLLLPSYADASKYLYVGFS